MAVNFGFLDRIIERRKTESPMSIFNSILVNDAMVNATEQ
jgi:hypothetical protein